MANGRTISLPQIPTDTTFGAGASVDTPQLVLSGYSITETALAAGENELALSSSVKYYRIRAKNNSILTITTTSGGAASLEICPGQTLEPAGTLDLASSLSLFITANKASTDLTVELWT